MNPALAALLLPLTLAACAPSGACVVPIVDVIPMTLSASGTRLTVPARVAGHDLTLIVDTGSEVNLVSRSSLPSDQRTYGRANLEGIGGSSSVPATDLKQLEFGRLRGGTTAYVTDQIFTVDGRKVDGLIGTANLGAYDFDLDVPERQLRLYAPRGDCGKPSVAMPPPLYAVPEIEEPNHRQRVRLRVTIGREHFSALIDTGAENTTLFRSAARRLGLTSDVLAADRAGFVHGVGHVAERAHVHMLGAVSFGDLEIRNLPVAVVDQDMPEEADVDMLIGMDFVRRAHLWISNSSHTVIVQFPPGPSTPLPAGLQ